MVLLVLVRAPLVAAVVLPVGVVTLVRVVVTVGVPQRQAKPSAVVWDSNPVVVLQLAL